MTISSVETTLQALMGAIVTGEFDNGVPPQDQLALKYNVSRTVLREAISKLEYSNILTSRPKVGTRVVPRNQWKLLNPFVASTYFENMPGKKKVTDMLLMLCELGPSAGDLTSERIARHVLEARPYDGTIAQAAQYQAWLFKESGNLIYAELAPLVEDFFTVISPLVDASPTSSALKHLRAIHSLVLASRTGNLQHNLDTTYYSLMKALEADLYPHCAQAA